MDGFDQSDSIRAAAIRAEYESGKHEPSEAAARSHVLVRVIRMSIGTLITLGGVAMLPLPGPGLPIVAFGLAILARDVAWADRLLGNVRSRVPRNADGGISRGALLTMIVGGLAGLSLSAWWFLVR